MNESQWSEQIYRTAIQCGFDNCGIIPVEALDGFDALLDQRIRDVPQSQGFYKNMGSLRSTKERFPWARSIVILTFDYGKYRYPKELRGKYAKAFFLYPEKESGRGFDAGRLERWFAEHGIRAEGGEDIGIGPLRYIAQKAGLGMIRKNNFLYTENGSYVSLLGYVIDKPWELIQKIELTPCGETCDLCQRACRTKALQAPYTMNPLNCVSFWTTFGNCDVPQWLDAEMFEEWICGCDNCQDACPHNRRHDWDAGEPFSNLAEIAPMVQPENYENLSDGFLIEQLIAKTSDHLQASDVGALRKNAERALRYRRTLQEKGGNGRS